MVTLEKQIADGVEFSCASHKCYSNHSVSFECIRQAIATLKKGKQDSNCQLSSDHLIRASTKLCPFFLKVF